MATRSAGRCRTITLIVAVLVFAAGGLISWVVVQPSALMRNAVGQQLHNACVQLGLLAETPYETPRTVKAVVKPARPKLHDRAIKPAARPEQTAVTTPQVARPAIAAEAVVDNRRVTLQPNSKDSIVVGIQQ
jgi:hypothetical protein